MFFEKLISLTAKKTAGMHAFLTILWIILMGLTGWLDYIIPDLSLFIFYTLIVILASLFLSTADGIAASIIGALLNYFTNQKYLSYHSINILYFDLVLDILIFLMIAFIVNQLRKSLNRERMLSRMDFLTDSANKRYFTEILDLEIQRSSRTGRPFSLAYIDLDNFKKINDTMGHSIGDKLLKIAGQIMKENIRQNDLIGRLGGDEFIILLTETGEEASYTVLDRILKKFRDEMKEKNYPVSLSIGYAAFLKQPSSVDEALKIADETMYRAKNNGKNKIEMTVWK